MLELLVTKAKQLRESVREWRTRMHKYAPAHPVVPVDQAIRLVAKVHGVTTPRMTQLRFLHRMAHPADARLLQIAKIGIGLSLLWFAIAAALFFRTTVPAAGGKLVEAVVGAPEAIVPILALSDSDADADIALLVYSGLTKRATDGAVHMDLADTITVDNSMLRYTVALKKNVVWHDGEPFTARDVLFTYELMQNPQSGSVYYPTFQQVKIERVDEYTVQFTLKEPYTEFLSALTVGIMPEHVWTDVPVERLRFAKYALRPIGTGPFMFDEFSKDASGAITEYRLKRFDKYAGTAPYLDAVRFLYFPTYESGVGGEGPVEALRQEHVSSLSYVPFAYKEKVERKYITLYHMQLPQYVALFFRTDSGFASQLEMRKALSFAIDKERVAHDAVQESVDIVSGPILPNYPGYSVTTATSHDIAKSNELLDSFTNRITVEEYRSIRIAALRAGSTSSTESVSSTLSTNVDEQIGEQLAREIVPSQTFFRTMKKGGEPLAVRIVTADRGDYARIARIVADMWREAGVRVDVDVVDPKNIARDSIRDRSYDVLLFSVIVGHDPDQYPFWHSSQREYPGLNLSRYASQKADEALMAARAATSTEERAKFYRTWEDILLADTPAVFLYTPAYTYAVQTNVKGIVPHSIVLPAERFLGISEWYIKEKSIWRFAR